MDGAWRRPTTSSLRSGTPSLGEVPSGGAKAFWLLLGLSKSDPLYERNHRWPLPQERICTRSDPTSWSAVRPPSQASQLPHLDCGASVRSASAVSPSREQAPSPQVQHRPKLCRSLCCDSGKPPHGVLTVRLLSQASQLPQGFVAAVRRRTWPPSHSNPPPTSTAHGWPRWSGWRPPPTGWPSHGC